MSLMYVGIGTCSVIANVLGCDADGADMERGGIDWAMGGIA